MLQQCLHECLLRAKPFSASNDAKLCPFSKEITNFCILSLFCTVWVISASTWRLWKFTTSSVDTSPSIRQQAILKPLSLPGGKQGYVKKHAQEDTLTNQIFSYSQYRRCGLLIFDSSVTSKYTAKKKKLTKPSNSSSILKQLSTFWKLMFTSSDLHLTKVTLRTNSKTKKYLDHNTKTFESVLLWRTILSLSAITKIVLF